MNYKLLYYVTVKLKISIKHGINRLDQSVLTTVLSKVTKLYGKTGNNYCCSGFYNWETGNFKIIGKTNVSKNQYK